MHDNSLCGDRILAKLRISIAANVTAQRCYTSYISITANDSDKLYTNQTNYTPRARSRAHVTLFACPTCQKILRMSKKSAHAAPIPPCKTILMQHNGRSQMLKTRTPQQWTRSSSRKSRSNADNCPALGPSRANAAGSRARALRRGSCYHRLQPQKLEKHTRALTA